MSDRDGASPDGEAPGRVPAGQPAEGSGAPSPPEPGSARTADPPPGPTARAMPAEAAIGAPDDEPVEAADRGPVTDPFEPYRPAEPTLRAGLGPEREFDVPFDTGQLRRLSTGQLLVVHRPDGVEAEAIEVDTQRRVYSWVAAVVGTLGAAASLFVGWMLPLSIAAIVFGVLGLRREDEGRTLAFVGIGTGIAGLVFSAVWIGYYAIVFGALPN